MGLQIPKQFSYSICYKMNLNIYVGFCVWSLFCGVVLDVHSSLAIILLRKRELVALLSLCYCCLCSVSLPQGGMGWFVV